MPSADALYIKVTVRRRPLIYVAAILGLVGFERLSNWILSKFCIRVG